MKVTVNYRPGSDPSVFAEHHALQLELTKLTCPTCPDVNWKWVEYNCLRLFAQNGAELYSAAALTLTRAQLYGLPGLNSGIVFINTQLNNHRSLLWPPAPVARQEILHWLFIHLECLLKELEFIPGDLHLLKIVRIHLIQLTDLLGREGVLPVRGLNSIRKQLENLMSRLKHWALADEPWAQ
ncbi:hypothetical protein [Pseudomonas koreensis]|uniref:hypothetical protein n=1 Tax=Pseudomonas koreensis TaxID=198620 RepID=UPI00380B2D26